MKLSIAASALVAIASALPEQEVEKRQDATPTAINTISVLNLLATAIPQSLLELAYTNAPALSSEIASEFAAKQTPAWFSALPSDVQGYLVPATTINQAPGIFLSALPTAATYLSTIRPAHSTTTAPHALNTTAPYPGLAGNSTLGVAGGASGTAGSSGLGASTVGSTTTALTTDTSIRTVATTSNTRTASASAQSTGGAAAFPTGVLGAGVAGALGVAGLLAL